MGSPILGRVLAPGRDGKRVDCFPLPAWLGWKAGEECGIIWAWGVASKRARREKCSRSFGCFILPSPPSPAGEEHGEGGEGSARKIQHIFKCFSPPLSSVLHSHSPPKPPLLGELLMERRHQYLQAPTGPFFFGAAASPSPSEALVAGGDA